MKFFRMINPHVYVASARWSNRQFARNPDCQQATLIHFQKCYSTIQEIFDHPTKYGINILQHDPCVFLDIACAPGGFSQYLLDHFPLSQGYGITLPQTLGGFHMAVHANLPSRFQLCYFDLLSPPMAPSPQIDSPVDIAIGDAQYLPRSQEALEEYKGRKAGTVTGGRLGLLLGEFVIALSALKEGGSFIFRFVVWEKVHSNILRLFFLCFELFESVRPFKSEYQHTADCTFYAVCTGFKRKRYVELDIETHLKIAYARVVLSPAFAAVHNGTINCFQVIDPSHCQPGHKGPDTTEPTLNKPDAHIFESLYPFKDMKKHEYFQKTCDMFTIVYKMFLIGQSSYTDHYKI